MKKVFIGGPFKGLINPKTGKMDERDINMFKSLIDFFTLRGYKVHNAHQREKWGEDFWNPDNCTKLDYEEIFASDVFIAFPGSPPSPGTHIEMGWASAHSKKIVLLLKRNEYYCHLTKGLHTIADVSYIFYDDYLDNLEELENIFPDHNRFNYKKEMM
jgi:hypothetical protein